MFLPTRRTKTRSLKIAGAFAFRSGTPVDSKFSSPLVRFITLSGLRAARSMGSPALQDRVVAVGNEAVEQAAVIAGSGALAPCVEVLNQEGNARQRAGRQAHSDRRPGGIVHFVHDGVERRIGGLDTPNSRL